MTVPEKYYTLENCWKDGASIATGVEYPKQDNILLRNAYVIKEKGNR